jgi:hypothetical protein
VFISFLLLFLFKYTRCFFIVSIRFFFFIPVNLDLDWSFLEGILKIKLRSFIRILLNPIQVSKHLRILITYLQINSITFSEIQTEKSKKILNFLRYLDLKNYLVFNFIRNRIFGSSTKEIVVRRYFSKSRFFCNSRYVPNINYLIKNGCEASANAANKFLGPFIKTFFMCLKYLKNILKVSMKLLKLE